MLNARESLVLGMLVLMFLLQVRMGYAGSVLPPVVPPGFVAVIGPHGVTILVGPLQPGPNGGYEREVIVPGRPPFMVNTESGVTPQDIADIYG
ncbi:MAG TPA: hypothetical protein VEI80_06945 [Candidatus Acidoferrales bacterium]|nr:hypothetical protein [Candidatus Acidoferrales bacterium]